MNSTYIQLKQNLEYLKMKQMLLHLDEVLDFITANNLSFTEGLVKLTSHEIDFKEANMIRSMVKVGAFPHHKELNDFDFEFQSSINEQEIRDFETLRFLEAAENIVFLGSSGVGKTHLATSIGIAAAKKRYSTYFIKCHDLTQLEILIPYSSNICPNSQIFKPTMSFHKFLIINIPTNSGRPERR